MNKAYEKQLKYLLSWIDSTNRTLSCSERVMVDSASIRGIRYHIKVIAGELKEEYCFYADQLNRISDNLFRPAVNNLFIVNNAAFGELFLIIHHIDQEPENRAIWREIHPRITQVSQGLFCDGYYDSAAEKAIKELESTLRELFQELKPGVPEPARVVDVIGALLSENGVYHIADVSTVSGKNYRRGVQLLFEGIFAAYRNPTAHKNLSCTKREAMERIMLSSQLMYVLDKP